ncbi:hypothetical protein RDABS01_007995, partial [Bienertia sinuspersici]
MRNRKSRKLLHEHYHLPPDLWSEILVRLPPKTLLRFRCNNCLKTQLIVRERVPKTIADTILTIRRSDIFRKIAQLAENSKSHMIYRSCMIHGLMLMECHDELSAIFLMVRRLLGFAPSSNDYKVVFLRLLMSLLLHWGLQSIRSMITIGGSNMTGFRFLDCVLNNYGVKGGLFLLKGLCIGGLANENGTMKAVNLFVSALILRKSDIGSCQIWKIYSLNVCGHLCGELGVAQR